MINLSNEKNPEIILSINGEKINFSSVDFKLPEEVLQLLFEINEGKRALSSTSQSLSFDELIKDKDLPKLKNKPQEKDKTVIVIDTESFKEKEENESAFGVELGKTTRKEVKQIMSEYVEPVLGDNKKDLKYEQIGVSFHFSNKDIVNEINIFNPEWKTLKGLKINDTLDTAIKLYGQPKMRSPKWLLWKDISVFVEDNLIKSIRLQK